MGKKKRRSRRSRKRFRYAGTILIFSLCSLLFVHTQLPNALQLPQNPVFKSAIPSSSTAASSPSSRHTRSSYSLTQSQSTSTSSHARSSTATATSGSSTTQATSTPPTSTQSTTPPPGTSSTQSTTPPSGRTLRPGEIPKGPYPLTPLQKSSSRAHEGSSWSASITRRVGSNFPLHWLAEVLHAPPENPLQPVSSIFAARRKGAWIGCERSTWLICKGAYRAIKKTNAITIVDTSCERNKRWLPHVIKKLTSEFRLVRLTCLGQRVEGYDDKVQFLDADALTGALPNGTDLVIAYKFVERGTLISAMKLFKNVKKAHAKYLLTENFPEEENVVKKVENGTLLRLNGGMPPFWFPAPEYEYENKAETGEGVAMQIIVSRVEELFEEKLTPGMAELVDPRKRTVRE